MPQNLVYSSSRRPMRVFKLLAACVAALSVVSWQTAGADATHTTGPAYAHVLIFEIDGFRQADLDDPLLVPDMPNILAFAHNGIVYANAATSVPSDSFPGLMNLVTGASPRTTGVYYDVSYSRTLYPPGTFTVDSQGFIATP